jgi:hypothetical protein
MNHMLKVGKNYIEVPKRRRMTYKDIPYDHGWADAEQYLPANYDLMVLKVKGKPILYGWCFGTKWEGAKIERYDEILKWKRVL